MSTTFRRLVLSLCIVSVLVCAAVSTVSAQDKVKVELYFESFCPDCQEFISGTLAGMVADSGLSQIFDLDLIPYGNAHVNPDGSITCQHAEKECMGNKLETCSIALNPSFAAHWSFIFCLENYGDEMLSKVGVCATQAKIDAGAITKCANSAQGQQLELQMANRTQALHPAHTFVPWVLVNGSPIEDDFDNVQSYVCNAYTGPKPSACSQTPKSNIRLNDAVPNHRIHADGHRGCLRED